MITERNKETSMDRIRTRTRPAMNADVLTEILLRLPLKSVARFKSVSQQFLTIISTTPQFSLPKPTNSLTLLISQSPSSQIHTPLLIPLHHDRASSFQQSLNLNPNQNQNQNPIYTSTVITTHSCNGLLIYCLLDEDTRSAYHSKIVVYNPTTTKFKTLPHKYPLFFHTISAYLAFDPESKTQYDVVCFCTSESNTHVMIYSPENQNWRVLGALRDTLHSYEGGFFHNSYIYLASLDHGPENEEEGAKKKKLELYRFSLEREAMERVALPRGMSEFEYVLYLGLCQGSLCLITGVYGSDFRYEVGVVNVYGVEEGDWSLRYGLGDVGGDLRGVYRRIKVVPSVGDWDFRCVIVCKVAFFDPEERCLYFEVGKVVARYDIEAREVVEVFNHDEIGFPSTTCYDQHMEILYSDGLTQSGL